MIHNRIEIDLTPNTAVIPFDYQYELVQSFNKMMGFDETPDNALYTIGWLQPQQGGQYSVEQHQGLNFQDGARFFVTCHNPRMAEDVVRCLAQMEDVDFFYGMEIEDLDTIPTPDFGSKTRFFLDSPALVRQTVDGRTRHLTYKDPKSAVYLSNTLRTKMNLAGLDGDVLVYFDETYPKAKEKLININGELAKCSICPVWIEASSPEIVKFAWEVGIGNATGAGFGAIAPYQPQPVVATPQPLYASRENENSLVYR